MKRKNVTIRTSNNAIEPIVDKYPFGKSYHATHTYYNLNNLQASNACPSLNMHNCTDDMRMLRFFEKKIKYKSEYKKYERNIEKKTITIDTTLTLTNHNDIIDYIVNNSIHERITLSIIKAIANNDKFVSTNETCMQFVNNGYRDAIIDDLKQEVFLKLFELVDTNMLTVSSGKLLFSKFTTKNGTEKSTYTQLYRTVENYLYAQKMSTKNKESNIAIIDAESDENGNITEKIVSRHSCEYRLALNNKLGENALIETAQRSDIKSFFRIIKEKNPKNYSDICKIFEGLFLGMTYKSISNIYNLSERRIKYLIPLMRKMYCEYNLHVTVSEKITLSEFEEMEKIVKCNGSIASSSNIKLLKDRRNYVIKVAGMRYLMPKLSHNIETILCDKKVIYTDNSMREFNKKVARKLIMERDKKMEEIAKLHNKDNEFEKLHNIYDKEKNRIIVANESGNILYTIKCIGNGAKLGLETL